ncbi:spermine oxidase-like [Atheta coriaria]|uniref:spermine oxidase-like n=1 Tax=Dalotia coriaria TaxID=877792 RepID=UPI0031F40357
MSSAFKFKNFTSKLLAFLLILSSSHGAYVPKVNSDTDVIIIGAGPAGVAAATKLDQQGINVKVFEANEWIGGRVHSIKFGDAWVDLGAEWCHGEKENIVFDLMKESQVLQHPNYTFEMAVSDGHIVDEEFSTQLFTIFDELFTPDGARNSTVEDSVGTYFTKWAYHTFNLYVLSSEGAFSWFEPAALSDYKDCDGDHAITWNGLGYKTILDKLMANFDQKKINLLTVVKQITFDEDKDQVTVLLATGEKHTAKHVIFTPSLGVLKHDHKSLFQPPLPQRKVEAIEALGIGAVMKVMLHFPEHWWATNGSFSGYSFVWTQEDRDTLATQYRKGPYRNNLSWLTNFMGMYRVEQNPKVLSCWFTGEFVPEIETMSDDILLDGINFTINKFLGKKYNVQQPDDFRKSAWYSNEFVRGTYSYQTLASRKIQNPSANVILSQPILNKDNIPRILFAGEATHPRFYSTVHGAIESGFREADRLIEIIKH